VKLLLPFAGELGAGELDDLTAGVAGVGLAGDGVVCAKAAALDRTITVARR
jgi:hypothetical protein